VATFPKMADDWKKIKIAGGSWFLHPAFNQEVFLRKFAKPDRLLSPPAEPLTNDAPERGTYVVRVDLPEISQSRMIIKRYRPKNFWRSLKYLFTKSPARRAFEKAALLQRYNIPTAAPLAVGEARRFRWLKECYLIMEEVVGATSLRQIRRDHPNQPDIKLMRQLARLIAKFHNVGLLHSDPTLGNFLVRHAESNRAEFVVIDLDGLRVAGDITLRSGAKSLRLLLRRIRMLPRERLWFLTQYAKDRGLPARKVVQMYENHGFCSARAINRRNSQ
jgi:tRNA A-37 threonylcarbamoyl transferase component Bud32